MSQPVARYGRPYTKQAAEFGDLERLLDEQLFRGYRPTEPLLQPDDEVVTLGSCFAANVAGALQQHGMRVRVNRFHEEANSPLANALLLDYLIEREGSEARSIFEPYIPLETTEALLDPIRTARCLIFTVGVGITCYDRQTDKLVLRPNETPLERLRWDFPTPDESEQHLRHFMGRIRELNPKIQIVLTLSPVPLYRAITTPSAFVEDAISKSHLRVAIHQLFASDALPGVHYWPSFEAFRWVGPHVGGVYGQDDNNPRHASKWMVNHVASLFVKYFAAEAPAAAPSTGSYDEHHVCPLIQSALPQ